jgi:hypothetical protein
MHLTHPDEHDPDQFLHKAKLAVRREIEFNSPDEEIPYFEVYIVWFSKTLQNWKAMLSSQLPDGRYYEVTYNGDKEEMYVDTYEKIVNSRVPDNPTEANKYERNYSDERYDPDPEVQARLERLKELGTSPW